MQPNETNNNAQTFVNAWDKSQGEVLPYRRDPAIERMYSIYTENVTDLNNLKVLFSRLVGSIQGSKEPHLPVNHDEKLGRVGQSLSPPSEKIPTPQHVPGGVQ